MGCSRLYAPPAHSSSSGYDSEQIVSKMLTTFFGAGCLLLCHHHSPRVVFANEEIDRARVFFFRFIEFLPPVLHLCFCPLILSTYRRDGQPPAQMTPYFRTLQQYTKCRIARAIVVFVRLFARHFQ